MCHVPFTTFPCPSFCDSLFICKTKTVLVDTIYIHCRFPRSIDTLLIVLEIHFYGDSRRRKQIFDGVQTVTD